MNLPNSLTVSRIFLVPLLVVVLLTKFEGHLIVGVPNEIGHEERRLHHQCTHLYISGSGVRRSYAATPGAARRVTQPG